MTRNKKIIISAIVVLLIVLIAVGTIFTINLINSNNNKKASPVEAVNDLRTDAEKARASGDKAEAKTLLTKAQQQVNELPKTDTNTNTKVDIEAQLWLLEHANK